MSAPTSALSLHTVDTEYSADCIEFCPIEGYHHLFVCGTYQVLDPSEKGDGTTQTNRTGRLLLFTIAEGLKEVQRIETNAILDAKWSRTEPVLAVSDAKGRVVRYRLSGETLEEVEAVQVADPSVLCLSLDYSKDDIVTSLSSGTLCHLEPTPTGLQPTTTWQAHSFEPWITSWDRHTPHRVWSGGDDLLLKSWDVRSPQLAISTTKGFEGGVTTAASSPHTEHLLAVGSYDSHLRLFDTRSPRFPYSTIEVPGGIWRTRFHPDSERKNDLLLACMHGGFEVLRLDGTQLSLADGESSVIKTFEHESLAYGADWCRMNGAESTIATCSFYDHRLHVWQA